MSFPSLSLKDKEEGKTVFYLDIFREVSTPIIGVDTRAYPNTEDLSEYTSIMIMRRTEKCKRMFRKLS